MSPAGSNSTDRRWPRHVGFTPDSGRIAALPRTVAEGRRPTWRLPLCFRQWPGDFTGAVDEQLRRWAEGAILQREYSNGPGDAWQINRQFPDERMFVGKAQHGLGMDGQIATRPEQIERHFEVV